MNAACILLSLGREWPELRELVRHRAKLVAMRSQCKAHVHAILAKGGIWVPLTDLFGVEGNLLLDKVTMPAPYKARIASLRRLIEAFDAWCRGRQSNR